MTAEERADATIEIRELRLQIAQIKREIAVRADEAYGDDQDSLAYDELRFDLWPLLDRLRDRRDALLSALESN